MACVGYAPGPAQPSDPSAHVTRSARDSTTAPLARLRGSMKYRHQYHAGNFADVHKHVLLLDVLASLGRKDKGILFVDTHAGRGEYDLHPGDAEHPAEWQSGAAKLLAAAPRH